jgi:hypothetical protein
VVIYKNGVSQATGSITATGTANGGIAIGWRPLDGGQYFNGIVGEAVVYAAAQSDADRDAAIAYLKTKWGF